MRAGLFNYPFGKNKPERCQPALTNSFAIFEQSQHQNGAISGSLFSNYACSIFIDLKKAFDTVNHTILLKTLITMGYKASHYNGFSLTSLVGNNLYLSMATHLWNWKSNICHLFNYPLGKNKPERCQPALTNSFAIFKQSQHQNGAISGSLFSNYACGIFIDLKKAFDTVNHTILLKTLITMGYKASHYNGFSLTSLVGNNVYLSMATHLWNWKSNMVFLRDQYLDLYCFYFI